MELDQESIKLKINVWTISNGIFLVKGLKKLKLQLLMKTDILQFKSTMKNLKKEKNLKKNLKGLIASGWWLINTIQKS